MAGCIFANISCPNVAINVQLVWMNGYHGVSFADLAVTKLVATEEVLSE